jgi:hypothetical protein
LVTALVVAGDACAQRTKAPREKVRRLALVGADARDYRLGFGVAGKIPNKAFKIKVGRETLRFWDLNDDGKLSTAVDGLSLEGLPFIVKIPEVLLLPTGQFHIAFPRDLYIALQTDELDLPANFVKQCATVTRLRITHGKQPLRLDGPASKACEMHCNYMHLNPLGGVSMSLHDEDPSKKGYTLEGAEAGKRSCISPISDVPKSLAWNSATIWHAEPVMDPDVTAFGCASAHGWTLLRPMGGTRSIPFLHPADGAEDVPCEFGPDGEFPNPVPGTRFASTCGHPIFVKMRGDEGRLTQAVVIDEKGQEVEGTTSCPLNLATPDWPTNSGCAVFVPSKPLRAGTRHRITFRFANDRVITWQFRTRSSKGRLKKWRYTPEPEFKD